MIRQSSGTTMRELDRRLAALAAQPPPDAGALSASNEGSRSSRERRRGRPVSEVRRPVRAVRIGHMSTLPTVPSAAEIRPSSAPATSAEELLDRRAEGAEAEGETDDEEADDHGVLGRALALLALELGDELDQLERNPLEHSLPPIRTCRPALIRHCLTRLHLGGALDGAPHREGVDRTTPSDQLPVCGGDNRAVADHIDLTRSDGRPVCRARVADSFVARFRGLMGVADLPAGEGLLFPRTRSVHTHFMRFPIDVVFLDGERRIVAIRPALRPWRFAAAKGARSVLELAPASASGSGSSRATPSSSARPPAPPRGRARTRSGAPRSGS